MRTRLGPRFWDRFLVRPTEKQPGRRGAQGGLVILELALVLPLVLVMLVGVVTVGHSFYVRNELIHEATVGVHRCVRQKKTAGNDCQRLVAQRVRSVEAFTGHCQIDTTTPGVGVDATTRTALTTNVKVLELSITCRYKGIVAGDLLTRNGLEIRRLAATARLPLTPP